MSSQSLKAQELFWVKTIDSGANSSFNSLIQSGTNKYSFLLGSYIAHFSEGYKIGNHILKYPTNGSTNFQENQRFISKIDTSGNVLFAKKIFSKNHFNIDAAIYSDDNDNLYIKALINDSIRVFEDQITVFFLGKRKTFIIKIDKNGLYKWKKEIGNDHVLQSVCFANNKFGILLNPKPNQTNIIHNFDTLKNCLTAYLEIDTNGNQIKFGELINSSLNKTNYIVSSLTFNNSEIVLNSFVILYKPNNNISNKGKLFISDTFFELDFVKYNYNLTMSSFHLVQLKFDINSLKIIDYFKISDDQMYSNGYNNHVLSIGYNSFYKSIEFYDTGKIFDRVYINDSFTKRTFVSFLYKNNKLMRFFNSKEKIVNTINKDESIVKAIFYHNSFSYIFQSKQLDKEGTLFNYLKIDSLNNVLVSGYVPVNYNNIGVNFSKDSWNGIYFNAKWDTDIEQRIDSTSQYWKFYQKTKNSDRQLLFKLWDYSITRGNISKGPYCAGDTFLIPYSKDGNFQSNNQFIAELSDEEGNFEGGHRELGRLQSNKDSTIKGVLPLFDVATSPKYRIRIVSTHPPVQSYYRYDSLRLLIYSKDTANAGADTSVCEGSKIQLKTSGGSLWRWSPGNLVTDSTQRITSTLPIKKATHFRIIISDSSGCGKTDTAYKWVLPGNALHILNPDTTVCFGLSNHWMRGSGGKGFGYQYQWLDMQNNVLSDSQLLVYNGSAKVIKMVLSDGCSINDTQLLNLLFFDSLKISSLTNNKICEQLPFYFKTKTNGGSGANNFKWFQNNIVLSVSDSILVNSFGQKTYKLLATDKICKNYKDSQNIILNAYEKLSFKLPQDTLICNGFNFSFSPVIQSGVRNGLYWFYTENGTTKDSFQGINYSKSFTQKSTIKVKAFNLCNQAIIEKMEVDVTKPILFMGVADTFLCTGQSYQLKATTTGGDNPKIRWKTAQNNVVKSAYFIDTTFLPTQNQILYFDAEDRCALAQTKTEMRISIAEPLQATLTANPLCFKDTVSLLSVPFGGKPSGYQPIWKDNAGQIIGSENRLQFSTKNKAQFVYYQLSDPCSVPFVDSIFVQPQTIAVASVNQNTQCFANQSFVFLNQSIINGVTQFNWKFDPQFITNTQNDTVLKGRYLDSGNYKTMLSSTDQNSCKDSVIINTKVLPLPLVDVKWQRTTNTFDRSNWRFTATASQPIKNYFWQINSFAPLQGNPVFQYFANEGKVNVKIKVEDNYGCFTDSLFEFDLLHRMRFYIPNMITANNDGINEGFFVAGSEFMSEFGIKIYNRWGEKVFESNNPNEVFYPQFDGNNYYIYVLNIFDIFNERHLINGSFGVMK